MTSLSSLQVSPPSHGNIGQLLTPQQVADVSGFGVAAIYRAVQRGELRAHRLCGRLRIAPQALSEWLEASAVEARPARASERHEIVASAPSRGRLRPLHETEAAA